MASTAPLAGIVLITRHGDRQGFYQSPKSYTAVETNLTVLGYVEEYKNGQDLRSTYLTGSGAIQGIAPNVAQPLQLNVLADGGGEGGVIIDSANALLQGLYPATTQNITLANGTTVSWPYAQLIEIETIEPDQVVWMEGFSECDAWTNRLNDWYESDGFKQEAVGANKFFQNISGLLGNRPATLENAWNIFDYLNVNFIHNNTLAPMIGNQMLEQARTYANYHETGAFSDPDPSNIGNVAGQAFLPPMLDNLNQVANSSNPLKIAYMAASYKPFTSLFKMMNVTGLENPDGVVDYASAAIFEVRTDGSLRFLFRNGTEGPFGTYGLLGAAAGTDMHLSEFESKMEPYSLPDLADWCNACQTTNARGCGVLASLNGTGGAGYASDTSTSGRHHVSPVVAGVIGAMVTLAVAAALLGAWLVLGGLVKRSRRSGDGHAVRPAAGYEMNNHSRDNASSVNTHTGLAQDAKAGP